MAHDVKNQTGLGGTAPSGALERVCRYLLRPPVASLADSTAD